MEVAEIQVIGDPVIVLLPRDFVVLWQCTCGLARVRRLILSETRMKMRAYRIFRLRFVVGGF
jgi:hypothetical protein